MEKVYFKTGFWGFKRKQVLAYIDETHAAFANQLTQLEQKHQADLQELQNNLESKIREQEQALIAEKQQAADSRQQIAALTGSLQESRSLLAQSKDELSSVTRLHEEQIKEQAVLQDQITALQKEKETVQQALILYEQQLAGKDQVIVRQTEELTRLQTHVASLEQNFTAFKEDANQNTALVNCLNLLHGRNRALTQKIAKLEAQRENQQAEQEVTQYTKLAQGQQETVKNTEALFAMVRKEIQDALSTISDKIEQGSIAESEDGNYFVDMAKL